MKNFVFKSDFDGLDIHCAACVCEKPKAVLQIVHGMAEHKERYFAFMEFLAKNGVSSYIDDHRGHGESVNSKKELGYFGDNGADALISDLFQLNNMIKTENPDVPVIMLGHSMGALAARAYAIEHTDTLSALIVSGNPTLSSSAEFGVKTAQKAQQKHGKFAKSKLLTIGMFLPFVMRAPSLKTHNAWICTDKEVVKAYDKDEYCGFEFYANGYEALMKLMLKANSAKVDTLRTVFMSGEKDPCMGSLARQQEEAKAFNAELKIYKNMRHEILNEKEKATVYNDMLKFIESVQR